MELQSNNRLPLVTREGKTALICFNESEVTVEDVTMYQYDSVRVGYPYTYASLVSAIIKSRYDNDSMQAIINNHLMPEETPEHAAEFEAMQEWRNTAKDVAHTIMNSNEDVEE